MRRPYLYTTAFGVGLGLFATSVLVTKDFWMALLGVALMGAGALLFQGK